jgi:GntR family transcriptional regulator
MDLEWHDQPPLSRQLRDLVVATILDGALKDGDPLPSVRKVAVDHRVNPFSILAAYRRLVDEQLVETGQGGELFVRPGARDRLLGGERRTFFAEQWPRVLATVRRLGLRVEELLAAISDRSAQKADEETP